uniref:Uncharacterized protein n=1 Tax=Canis lupus familiaris TaxID=9615 RepID=A0A8P0T3Z1_CANLF
MVSFWNLQPREREDRPKAGSRQEEGFGVQPRRMADLGMVSNLRRSNSSLCKTRRLQHLFGNSAKQENLSSWIPENITKKECMYFVESSKLSDAGYVAWGRSHGAASGAGASPPPRGLLWGSSFAPPAAEREQRA